jgi:hypothetical protein
MHAYWGANVLHPIHLYDSYSKLLTFVGKDEGKIVPVLNKAQRHEDVLKDWRYSSMHSLTSALDGDEWSALHPGRFTSREIVHVTHCIGGSVGLRAGLDMVSKKIPIPRRDSNPRSSST